MAKNQEWKEYTWYCVNCGRLVKGCQNSKGEVKAICQYCRTAIVRTIKSPRHDIFHAYAPEGMEHI